MSDDLKNIKDAIALVRMGLERSEGEDFSPEHQRLIEEMFATKDSLILLASGFDFLVKTLLGLLAGLMKTTPLEELQSVARTLAVIETGDGPGSQSGSQAD